MNEWAGSVAGFSHNAIKILINFLLIPCVWKQNYDSGYAKNKYQLHDPEKVMEGSQESPEGIPEESLGWISKKSWWDPKNVMEESRECHGGKQEVSGSILTARNLS